MDRLQRMPLDQGADQMPHPEGRQDGALNPPDPAALLLGRAQLADISLVTSAQSQWGHLGGGSPDLKTSSSKHWQQALHWYS